METVTHPIEPTSVGIDIVVAHSRNRVIGREGQLPWKLTSDLRRFKERTLGKPIVMGRRTWEGLPKAPLIGRPNIVVSRDRDFMPVGAWAFPSISSAIAAAKAIAIRTFVPNICVIGGEVMFGYALPIATSIHITEVDADLQGDAYLPSFDESQWQEIDREVFPSGPGDEYAATLRILKRIANGEANGRHNMAQP